MYFCFHITTNKLPQIVSNYLNDLNEVQRNAVSKLEGPVMIIAGAGSGKTRVLTYRIAHLIKSGIAPFNILALTFTNKAEREMKERVVRIVGDSEAQNIWIGTFHSIFARVLRIESEKLGYPSNFTIYDTQDSKSLIKLIVKEFGLDDKVYKTNLILNRISLSKNNLITPEVYNNDIHIQKEDEQSAKPRLGEIYQTYVKRCFKAGAMDFDDLLFNMNYLLTEIPDALHKYQHKFQYVLIDEFQDTNALQYSIVKKLAAINENICVVGDDAQSIYAFRGANIQNILNYQSEYPDLKVFKLEQNYRSTKTIVGAANSVIQNNKRQLHKEVWTDNEKGEQITVLRSPTDNEEGRQIAHSIFESKANKNLHNIDHAILYRTNAQSRAMEEALRKMNIPYKIYGGLSFYQRKEVKDLIAYFRLTVNNKDEESLRRTINYPARGIGNRTLEKISVEAGTGDKTMWEIISNIREYNLGLSPAVQGRIFDFVSMIKSFSVELESKGAYELADIIATSSGINKDLYDNKTPEGLSRYENLQELLNGIKEFAETWSVNQEGEDGSDNKPPTLAYFLQDIALLTDADTDDPNDTNRVSLMTIHAAKGLEFPVLYVVGLEENLFPSQLSINSREDLEEERRLFYVALTRARHKAYLSYATTRYRWGNLVQCEPSRFLEEIDSTYLIQPEIMEDPPISRPTRTSGWRKGKQGWTLNKKKPDPPKSPPPGLRKNMVRMGKAVNRNVVDFEPDDTANLQVGMEVEHERFGMGKVLHLEGAKANQKATVFFAEVGQKQLLLKYAKLRIMNN